MNFAYKTNNNSMEGQGKGRSEEDTWARQRQCKNMAEAGEGYCCILNPFECVRCVCVLGQTVDIDVSLKRHAKIGTVGESYE